MSKIYFFVLFVEEGATSENPTQSIYNIAMTTEEAVNEVLIRQRFIRYLRNSANFQKIIGRHSSYVRICSHVSFVHMTINTLNLIQQLVTNQIAEFKPPVL
jgi:hypothetical protein